MKGYVEIRLKIIVLLLFIGRANLMYILDGPWRQFFWNESIMSPIVHLFSNRSWMEMVSNPRLDISIKIFELILALLLLLGSIASLRMGKKDKWKPTLFIKLAWLIVVLQVALHFTGHGFQIGYLIEHAAQVASPALLLLFFSASFNEKRFRSILKWAVALTFIGHGLFAIGFHPVPGNFIDMIIIHLTISETSARMLLSVVGFLDIVAALAILFGNKTKAILYYCIIWGFFTTVARLSTGFLIGGLDDFSLEWLWKFAIRWSHFLLPLLLLHLNNGKNSKEITSFTTNNTHGAPI